MTDHRVTYDISLAAATGLPAERLGRPGVSVASTDDRRGGRRVSHYRLGVHDLVWIDPDLADELADLDGRAAPLADDELRVRAAEGGAERLGLGFDHVLPVDWVPPVRSAEIVVLDPAAASTREAVAAMFAGCSADDLDEAEFDLDALDPILAGWQVDGRVLALAGARPVPFRPGFVDVGVLVRPEVRGAGVGRAVVAAVTELALDRGEPALYRCAAENEGSRRLCRSLGYEQVAVIEAFRWPDV